MVSKYKAKRCVVTPDGTLFTLEELKLCKLDPPEGSIKFDSQTEAEYYLYLQTLLHYKQIRDIEIQPSFTLLEGGQGKGITYRADFKVTNTDGSVEIIDVKGFETKDFKMKKKLFEAKYPDLKLRLITKVQGVWVDTEKIKEQEKQHRAAERALLKRARKG
jgi:hypothetical protein